MNERPQFVAFLQPDAVKPFTLDDETICADP